MRTTTAALIAATFLSIAAPAVAQEAPNTPAECPPDTMQGDMGLDRGRLLCVCVTDVNVIVYERAEDGTDDWVAPVESCPTERPPVPPEDCADAPPSCVPEVLSGTARPASTPSATPVAPTTAPVAQVANISPAFTG